MNESFVFYVSFHDAISELPDEQYGKVCRAINEYALYGTLPENMSQIERMVFTLVKPQIDANTRRKEGGAKGGRPKTFDDSQEQKNKKTEDANGKPEVTGEETIGFENEKPMVLKSENIGYADEKPNVNANENVNGNGKDNECGTASPSLPFFRPEQQDSDDVPLPACNGPPDDQTFKRIPQAWYRSFSHATAVLVSPRPADYQAARQLYDALAGDLSRLDEAVTRYFADWRDFWFCIKKSTSKLPPDQQRPDYSFAQFCRHYPDILASPPSSERPEKKPPPQCPVCHARILGTGTVCMTCGYERGDDPDEYLREVAQTDWFRARIKGGT